MRHGRIDRRPRLVPGRVPRPAVFERFYPKLLAGYVYDALESSRRDGGADQVLATLRRCLAKRGPSVALGEDIRIEGKGAIATGLALDGELVQISAYG